MSMQGSDYKLAFSQVTRPRRNRDGTALEEGSREG